MSELRDYQQRVIDEIYATWQQGKRAILLAMPTGSGKTRTFSELAKDFCDRDRRVLLLVHREELLWQAKKTLEKILRSPVGVIKADRPMQLEYPVQCASVQTLVKRLEKQEIDLGAIALVIIDEAHLSLAPSYLSILRYFPKALILGVTATPSRLDGRGFDRLYEALVIGPSVSELIWRGFLADYEVLAPESFLPTEEGIRIAGGDFNSADLAERIDRRYVAGCAVDAYLHHSCQKRCVVFAINLDHSKAIAERYCAAGIVAEHIDGETAPKDRQAILERFRAGETQVLCNVNLFTEGFDVPEIEVIQLCRPTKSVALHLQMLGRGLRPKGGRKALILDHAGNCLRLGGAKADRCWTLQGLTESIPAPEALINPIEEAIEFMAEAIEPPIAFSKTQIDLPNLPKRRVEIYETDVDFFHLPTHTELETQLAHQTYSQSQPARPISSRSPRVPSDAPQSSPHRDRRSAPNRQIPPQASPQVSSKRRSSPPKRHLSPLQQVSKAAIELAERMENILVWIWRSWFPPKRKRVEIPRRSKRPQSF
ncbi:MULTISPECIES: DEAD/DEAH box helicase [Pseudanabaena]|uniref:Type III restriction protein res subunit n=2 Tax=Pseudanabaena TaxID=1152 RepID=L8N2R4_9CYAN|nr:MULTISPECIES: DEAD/DEAH box helicase [Pseudanabaena]ELS33339.1 type III restriction protein res subunit [Pseudanabaena biceps PCC 7429]MDG3494436.1 DEAD/DEAH box helicase family protein [Pseudanabaena catenata USMAC16]